MINKKDLELKLLLRESHIQQLNLKIERLNNIIDDLVDIIVDSLDVDIVEKRFNMSFDNFKIWIKDKIKEN